MFSLWHFSLYFHWSPRFGQRSLCFTLCFSKQKSSSSDRRLHWRIFRGIFPVKATWKWRHLFVWILIRYNFFVIRYIFWLKIAVRHETLSVFISHIRNYFALSTSIYGNWAHFYELIFYYLVYIHICIYIYIYIIYTYVYTYI